VFKSVILGKSAAGVTLDVDIEKAPSEVTTQLRTIHRTEQLAPHPLSAHPRVPGRVRRAVTSAVLEMNADAAGQEALRGARLVGPVRADYGRDYRPLESIDIEKLGAEE
jgi:phosphonate transport system substrate-binding protein